MSECDLDIVVLEQNMLASQRDKFGSVEAVIRSLEEDILEVKCDLVLYGLGPSRIMLLAELERLERRLAKWTCVT